MCLCRNIGLMDRPLELDFCVLIPVYNNPDGLIKSLKTIHYAKEKHLVVVVDDGSTTPITAELLQQASIASPFHIICLPQNKGITEALNTGLHWIVENAPCRYIARLDSSDTCYEDRFYQQVSYLEAHPEVGLLGSWCTFRDKEGRQSYPYTTPVEHEAIEKEMYWRNVFIHPTVMFRKTLLEKVGVYPYNFVHAEDYAFFWALIKVSKGAILDRFLVTCEINSTGISMGNRKEQLKSRIKVVNHFGGNTPRKVLSFFKIKLLLFAPYRLILWYKGQKHKD